MVRKSFITFSIAMLTCSIILLVLGSLLFTETHDIGKIITRNSNIRFPIILLITCGIFALCTSLMSLFGGLINNRHIIGGMIFFLSLTSVTIINCAGFCGVYWKMSNSSIDKTLRWELKNYGLSGPNSEVNKELDSLQKKYHCCGVLSFKDWKDTPFYGNSTSYPHSCYSASIFNKIGCLNVLCQAFQDVFVKLAAATGTTSFFLFAGLLIVLSNLPTIFRSRRYTPINTV